MSTSFQKPIPVPDHWHSPALALSEEECHREHAAALDATVFNRPCDEELVFELEGGHLTLRARAR